MTTSNASDSGEFISFSCIPVTQPLGNFYVGSLDSTDLIKISFADQQRIERREVETFLGIERPLSLDRVKEIERYVNSVDATFPTSVLLAISSEDASYDRVTGLMRVRRAANVAEIIDGQHRIAGLKAFDNGSFQVNVTIFIDMDIEDRAMVFATINLKQTRVSKSIAYNLYEYATSRSPHKTAHDIAKLLNSKEGSPFRDRIKILGTATPGKEGETLTQAGFVDALVPLISDRPDADRDLLKRGKTLRKVDVGESRRLIFRNSFIDDRDAEIAQIVWNYFSAVARRWPTAWSSTELGVILNRTTGFSALMRFLPVIYNVLTATPGEVPKEKAFLEIFEQISIRDADFTSTRYLPGSTGPNQLFRDLVEGAGLSLD